MFFVVFGILQADINNTLLVMFLAIGVAFLAGVLLLHPRSGASGHREPLLSTGLFRNRISNLGLVTQNLQWLLLMGDVVHGLGLPPDRAPLQRRSRPA